MEVDDNKSDRIDDQKPLKVPQFMPAPNRTNQEKGLTEIKGSATEIKLKLSEGTVSSLDMVEPLEPESFPNPKQTANGSTPTTIPNIHYLLSSYGISVHYNTIRKKLIIAMPGSTYSPENADNVAMTQIISLATLNGISVGQVPSIVEAIGDRNLINPVADWITSREWDGMDRLQPFFDTLTEREGYPKVLKQLLMNCWLISAVAAAMMPSGFRARGALTLQGGQSIGKTAWVNSLVPDAYLREGVVKLDHHLDAGNKDSQIGAITHWIVEIGELDGSLKRDIARLKGFLTSDRDKLRRPYARTESEYPRKTVFIATVNDNEFLVDNTGNTRFWTIPVIKINYQHDIDMQQLFAQVAVDYRSGKQWWLTFEEEQWLEEQNKSHRSVSVIRERVLGAIDLEWNKDSNLPAVTPTEILRKIGIQQPTNTQCKECAAVLRELYGEPKKIQGLYKWRVPLLIGNVHHSLTDELDKY